MSRLSRRQVVQSAAAVALAPLSALAQAPPGERPRRDLPAGGQGQAPATVLNPRMRVPLSFFIDDSTCLVNMGHFCMPQFAEAWPNRDIYKKPWKTWPREIPDAFLREFGTWCGEHGVKGKWSLVPFPCCVGWLDRELPGWSRRELLDSLKLVREVMVPNWDIHPEMITHTRVIDLKTGKPLAEISNQTMENSYPSAKKSVDELAAYLACALQALKNCDIPCEGVTTPGGFGNAVKAEFSLAVHQAVRAVYGVELPHYFKYVADGKETTHPRLEHVSGLDTADPRAVASAWAGTGDWFGSWDGDAEVHGEKYCNADASSGRMVELIERDEPAVMLCHWPGLFNHGAKTGFKAFQGVATALNQKYRDRTQWMTCRELARYGAARELTKIEMSPGGQAASGTGATGGAITLTAPFACPQFTLRISAAGPGEPKVLQANKPLPLREVRAPRDLQSGTWLRQADEVIVCFDLKKETVIIQA